SGNCNGRQAYRSVEFIKILNKCAHKDVCKQSINQRLDRPANRWVSWFRNHRLVIGLDLGTSTAIGIAYGGRVG
ncbi:GM16465, partial [Drosophila sechellia]